MKETNAYGNISILSPDNQVMFLTNQNRLNSYLRRNLVEKVNDNQYRLLFEPKGLGYQERNTDLLIPRKNQCVCCGEQDILLLTRHHVIPTRFRKHFPDSLKSNNFKYVVLLCVECHTNYNVHEEIYNDELATQYGIKSFVDCEKANYVKKKKVSGTANALLTYLNAIPGERISILKDRFKELTEMEPSEENLKKSVKYKYQPPDEENNFGKLLVEAVNNVYLLQRLWLDHFIATMQPKYLPEDLIIHLERETI